MRRYILSPPAERDLNEIVLYLAEQASVPVARRVLGELKHALRFLAGILKQAISERT